MAYSETVLRRATERLRSAAEEKRAEYARHLAIAYEKYPRLAVIDRQLRNDAAEAVAACVRKGEDPKPVMERLARDSLRLQSERQWILDASDFDEDFLDETPVCTVCGGKGYVGAQMCECLRELCRQEQKKELSSLLLTGNERFENFSLRYYPDTPVPDTVWTARQLMRKNLEICRSFAAHFRPGESGNLLFTGATGLGKTFLSACIARQVADGGASVTYVGASRLFKDYEDVQFQNADPAILRKYELCDLLILDDLGTEMLKPFVVSALYTVVNERLLGSRSTIISTNLTPEQLRERYNAQTGSRITGCYQVLAFFGKDIRVLLPKKSLV